MPRLIEAPAEVSAAGCPSKRIEEFVGRPSTGTMTVSIARMVSPPGWSEPGQTPEFDEYTVVLRGALRAETSDGVFLIGAGQAFIVERGAWVRYSTPGIEETEYLAVCSPAFTPEAVHRSNEVGRAECRDERDAAALDGTALGQRPGSRPGAGSLRRAATVTFGISPDHRS